MRTCYTLAAYYKHIENTNKTDARMKAQPVTRLTSGIKFELDLETCFFVPESCLNDKKQPSVNMINQKILF